MITALVVLASHPAGAEEGMGTPVQVSCSSVRSLEGTYKLAAPGGFFAAGWTGARRPILARVQAGKVRWCKEESLLSTSEISGMLLHKGSLYVSLSTPAGPSHPLEQWTKQGWLRTAGRGRNKVSAILRLNSETGFIEAGTFLTASADDGTAGAFRLKAWRSEGDVLRITAWADWQPRMKNRIPMTCTGKGPFLTTMLLGPDLASVLDSKAERCVCCE